MPLLNAAKDFYFFPAASLSEASKKIIDLVKNKIPNKFGLSPVNGIQVLSPMNHGPAGSRKLSEQIQAELNPTGREVICKGKKFRIGDKVIQNRNNYIKNVFNGDMGIVMDIVQEKQSILVSIDGRKIIYDYSELDELALAYAISIHKSQGMEYPAVVIPILPEHEPMLQRNLLYTGITRAKKVVVLVGSLRAIKSAVSNSKTIHRHGSLMERIRLIIG